MIGDFFAKKKHDKTSERAQELNIVEAKIELEMLAKKAQRQLRREMNAVIGSQEKDPRAIERAKNTYYALKMIETAQKRMEDIGSSYELNILLNNLSAALKDVNSLERKTDDVNTFLLRWRERTMKSNVVAAENGGMREYFSKPLDELITEDDFKKLISQYRVDINENANDNEAASFMKGAGHAAAKEPFSEELDSADILDSFSE